MKQLEILQWIFGEGEAKIINQSEEYCILSKLVIKFAHINERNTFDKRSSTNTYTKKVFTITRIDGRSYYLDDLQKAYRGHELIKAVGDDMTSELDTQIEHAVKQEKVNRVLNNEDINSKNIIEEKRIRKPKKHFDE